ncbi:helix-turn-helix transcriptional regulator [Cupriavidus pauculus]|uniref:Helix-turn-helix transcriptional regulator n=1 Tax=Cupriavidus pauculus TaxID=82633 RepID=A0A2N5C6S0_9BURK|nr:helix-turn-helix transcriptional regulator [Cupriavidus pauculus]PLP97926.1 helix-turn-helix transcriptional regulator [Cupriavidus pauculus]
MHTDPILLQEIVRLYESEPDLLTLPAVLFDGVTRLTDADVVAWTEIHHLSGELRALLSVEDAPGRREQAFEAYARHAGSHPFWQKDPAFYGERAIRESDIFSDEEFMALPMAREVFLPSGAHRIMAVLIRHGEYSLDLSAHRIVGRPAFSDAERDRMQTYRTHVLRVYRQAQQRTVEKLSPADRLHYAFPGLTQRQVEAAVWLAQGKSNEAIAVAMNIGLDTVKAHLKAIFSKIGTDSRLALAKIVHTVPPFSQMPPLWKLPVQTWQTQASPVATATK